MGLVARPEALRQLEELDGGRAPGRVGRLLPPLHDVDGGLEECPDLLVGALLAGGVEDPGQVGDLELRRDALRQKVLDAQVVAEGCSGFMVLLPVC